MAAALRNKENVFSRNNSPIASPDITRVPHLNSLENSLGSNYFLQRKRVARTSAKEVPLLQRVLSKVAEEDDDIFSPTRVCYTFLKVIKMNINIFTGKPFEEAYSPRYA